MSEVVIALGIWLPLGTIVPLVLARLTGSDWRGALIEASIFATMGLIIFPLVIGLSAAAFTSDPNANLIFAVSFVLATITVLGFRRQSNKVQEQAKR